MEALTKKQIEKALDTEARVTDLGSEIPEFNAHELARVLEFELNKAEANGFTHIRLNMNLRDTAALAGFLRRGAIIGV